MLGSAYAKFIKALGHRILVLGYAPAPVQELIFLTPLPHLPLLGHATLTQTLLPLCPTRWGQNLCVLDVPQPASVVVMSLDFPWPCGGRADSRKIPVVPLPGTVTFGTISGCRRCV